MSLTSSLRSLPNHKNYGCDRHHYSWQHGYSCGLWNAKISFSGLQQEMTLLIFLELGHAVGLQGIVQHELVPIAYEQIVVDSEC